MSCEKELSSLQGHERGGGYTDLDPVFSVLQIPQHILQLIFVSDTELDEQS